MCCGTQLINIRFVMEILIISVVILGKHNICQCLEHSIYLEMGIYKYNMTNKCISIYHSLKPSHYRESIVCFILLSIPLKNKGREIAC